MNDNILMMIFHISKKQIWQSRQKNGTCERNGTPKHTMPYCHMLDILSCLSSSWWLLALSADKTFSTQTTTCFPHFPMRNNMKQESLEKKTPRKRHHTALSFLSFFFVKLTHLEKCSPNANPLPKTCHLERRRLGINVTYHPHPARTSNVWIHEGFWRAQNPVNSPVQVDRNPIMYQEFIDFQVGGGGFLNHQLYGSNLQNTCIRLTRTIRWPSTRVHPANCYSKVKQVKKKHHFSKASFKI